MELSCQVTNVFGRQALSPPKAKDMALFRQAGSRAQKALLLGCLSTSLGCASDSSLAVQSCLPDARLSRGMSQDDVREALGPPAVVGLARGGYRDPLRLAIASPAATPGNTWLYPAAGQPQNWWLVLTFHDRKIIGTRCAHVWFEMGHDAAEQPDAAAER